MIRGFVNGQTLRLSQERVVADTLDYLVARFLFAGEDWMGLEKWLHLEQGEYHYAIKLTGNETRKEDHLNLSAGQWLVWLHGNEVADGEVTERITTNVCALTVEETGGLEGEIMPPVAPEVAEQLEARMTALEREQAQGAHLPAVAASDEGKTLQVIGGRWAVSPQAAGAFGLRVNEQTDEWECSYDGGKTWVALGVKATSAPAFSEEDKLDPKYIDAEWMATKTQEGGSVELERDVAFTSAYASLGVQWTPDVGFDTFDVYWNGVMYTCSLWTGGGEAFLGNRALLGDSYPDTGEPFLLTGWALTGNDPTLTAIQKATGTAETVHIKVTTHATFSYSQLPLAYMTQALPYYVDVWVDIPDDGGAFTYTCGERMVHLEEILASGRVIRLRAEVKEGDSFQFTLLYDLSFYGKPEGELMMIFSQPVPILSSSALLLAPDGEGGCVIGELAE